LVTGIGLKSNSGAWFCLLEKLNGGAGKGKGRGVALAWQASWIALSLKIYDMAETEVSIAEEST